MLQWSPSRFEDSGRSLGLLGSLIFLLSASNVKARPDPQAQRRTQLLVSLDEPHGEKVPVGAHGAAEGRLVAGTFHQGHDESMKCENAKHCCCGGSPDVSVSVGMSVTCFPSLA